eukprot:g2379.t1
MAVLLYYGTWKVLKQYCEKLYALQDQLTGKFKISTGFYSIALLIGDVCNVRWPLDYLSFLGFFAIFKFDFFAMLRLKCAFDYNAHTEAYMVGCFLLAVECAIVIGLITINNVPRFRSHTGARKLTSSLLFLTYLIYPLGCKISFSIFNCMTIDGVSYLRSDLSIQCDSPAHKSAEAFCGFIIAMFPVGLPVLYFLMLHHKREVLFADDDSSISFLGFFYREYDQKIMLFLTYLGALMIKFQTGFQATGVYEEGYSADFVSAMLIGSGIVVAFCFGCTVVRSIFSVFGSPPNHTDAGASAMQETHKDQGADEEGRSVGVFAKDTKKCVV